MERVSKAICPTLPGSWDLPVGNAMALLCTEPW